MVKDLCFKFLVLSSLAVPNLTHSAGMLNHSFIREERLLIISRRAVCYAAIKTFNSVDETLCQQIRLIYLYSMLPHRAR